MQARSKICLARSLSAAISVASALVCEVIAAAISIIQITAGAVALPPSSAVLQTVLLKQPLRLLPVRFLDAQLILHVKDPGDRARLGISQLLIHF